jgi:hypothetical protein
MQACILGEAARRKIFAQAAGMEVARLGKGARQGLVVFER